MTGKARPTSLATQLNATPKAALPQNEDVVANRQHGDKGDHIKITVTLPPEVYKLISDEAARRKMNKEPNPQLSAVIREAVVAHFNKG